MASRDWRLELSERLYCALLLLYPVRFRVRFGQEMVQIFRDCCRDLVADGSFVRITDFWIRTVTDLAFSVPQEHRRELLRVTGANYAVLALADSLLIPINIGLNLVALGPVVTLLIAGEPSAKIASPDFVISSGIVAFALGSLGVLKAVLVARNRRTQCPSIKM